MIRTATVAVVLLLLPALGLPQSLADAARQEAERRKKVQSEGKAAPVAGEEALEKAAAERQLRQTPAEEPSSPATTPGGNAGSPSAAPTNDLDRERAQREKDEQLWHKRVEDANARVERARKEYDSVKDLALPPGESFVDRRTGQTVVRSPQELQRIVADAEAQLEAAERALEDLMEAARREGVPPGWLR